MRDQFLCGIQDKKIRERLLLQENISLEKATYLAVIHKRAAIEAGRIEEQSTAAAEPISKSTEKFSNKKCYRCGGP